MLKYAFITFFLSLSLFSSSLFGSPFWYASHSFKSHGNLYYGYGEGATEKEAKHNAAAEISEQISTYVSSTIDIMQTLDSSDVKVNTITASTATLKEMRIERKGVEAGRHYILLKYRYQTPLWFEQRTADAPLFSRVGYGFGKYPASARKSAKLDLQSQVQRLIESKVITVKQDKVGDFYFVALAYQVVPVLRCNGKQSPFLAQSTLIKQANKLTPCPYDYKLHRLNNRWYLKYKTVSLPLSKNDFDTFFKSINNDVVSIKTENVHLTEGDGFHLTISTKADGYVTLFNVYEDGKVGKYFKHKSFKANTPLLFPSRESGQELEAGLLVPGKATKDLYVAIFSDKKIALSPFEKQKGKVLSGDEYYFNNVISLCDQYDCTTLVLRTRPR